MKKNVNVDTDERTRKPWYVYSYMLDLCAVPIFIVHTYIISIFKNIYILIVKEEKRVVIFGCRRWSQVAFQFGVVSKLAPGKERRKDRLTGQLRPSAPKDVVDHIYTKNDHAFIPCTTSSSSSSPNTDSAVIRDRISIGDVVVVPSDTSTTTTTTRDHNTPPVVPCASSQGASNMSQQQ